MTNPFDLNPTPDFSQDNCSETPLWDYVQSMSPEQISHLSQPTSSEVFHVMEQSILGLLGELPPDGFGVSITASREQLGQLLASAALSGYFLRNAEQRLEFEQSLKSSV